MMKKYCLTITMTIDRSEYCRKNPVNLVDRLAETGQEHRHRLRSKGSTSAGEEQLQLFVCVHMMHSGTLLLRGLSAFWQQREPKMFDNIDNLEVENVSESGAIM